MFKIYAASFLAFAIVWLVAWFAFVRPALKRYALTTRLVARIDLAEGKVWTKIKLWFEGKKALIVLFLSSGFEMAKGAADQAAGLASGLTPDVIAPLQDKTMWSAFFGDIVSFHILAALQILTAILVVKGHLTAAAIVPAPGTAAPVTPVAPTPGG